MKRNHYFFSFIFLIFVSCNPQKKDIEPKATDVALTPPMGWNSFNCFGATVTESEVRANAEFMAKNLKKFGWEYIVIDYCWYYPHPPKSIQSDPPQFKHKMDGSLVPYMPMDEYGRLLPDPRKFPSSEGNKGFKPLADYIHSLGLKFGIHVMRGIPRQAVWYNTPVKGTDGITAKMIADTASICTWLNLMYGVDVAQKGAQEYYNSLFELYASWDVDYVKVDNINPIVGDESYRPGEATAVRKALDSCKRPMVLSFSSKLDYKYADHLQKTANMWRISNDFWDEWPQLKLQFAHCAQWAHLSNPKRWPDADMLPIGNLRLRGPSLPSGKTNFTENEQYTMMTLWSIFRSPLMMGGNLPDADDLVMKLLANDEVLEVNQKGENAREVYNQDNQVIWISDAPGKAKYVAIFNIGEKEQSITLNFSKFKLADQYHVRDCWKKADIGNVVSELTPSIPPHGSKLYKFSE